MRKIKNDSISSISLLSINLFSNVIYYFVHLLSQYPRIYVFLKYLTIYTDHSFWEKLSTMCHLLSHLYNISNRLDGRISKSLQTFTQIRCVTWKQRRLMKSKLGGGITLRSGRSPEIMTLTYRHFHLANVHVC